MMKSNNLFSSGCTTSERQPSDELNIGASDSVLDLTLVQYPAPQQSASVAIPSSRLTGDRKAPFARMDSSFDDDLIESGLSTSLSNRFSDGVQEFQAVNEYAPSLIQQSIDLPDDVVPNHVQSAVEYFTSTFDDGELSNIAKAQNPPLDDNSMSAEVTEQDKKENRTTSSSLLNSSTSAQGVSDNRVCVEETDARSTLPTPSSLFSFQQPSGSIPVNACIITDSQTLITISNHSTVSEEKSFGQKTTSIQLNSASFSGFDRSNVDSASAGSSSHSPSSARWQDSDQSVRNCPDCSQPAVMAQNSYDYASTSRSEDIPDGKNPLEPMIVVQPTSLSHTPVSNHCQTCNQQKTTTPLIQMDNASPMIQRNKQHQNTGTGSNSKSVCTPKHRGSRQNSGQSSWLQDTELESAVASLQVSPAKSSVSIGTETDEGRISPDELIFTDERERRALSTSEGSPRLERPQPGGRGGSSRSKSGKSGPPKSYRYYIHPQDVANDPFCIAPPEALTPPPGHALLQLSPSTSPMRRTMLNGQASRPSSSYMYGLGSHCLDSQGDTSASASVRTAISPDPSSSGTPDLNLLLGVYAPSEDDPTYQIAGDIVRRAWIASISQLRSPRHHCIFAVTLAKAVFSSLELAEGTIRGEKGSKRLHPGKTNSLKRSLVKYLGWRDPGVAQEKMREVETAIDNLCREIRRKTRSDLR